NPLVPKGVRNNPDPLGESQTNTITNVLFLMLSLRRYETSDPDPKKRDQKALATAGEVFDWFYNAPPCEDSNPPGANGLYNGNNLIRYYPSHYEGDRSWTGDQGWFWRACIELEQFDPARKTKIDEVITKLGYAVIKCVLNRDSDGIVRELNFDENYDIDF